MEDKYWINEDEDFNYGNTGEENTSQYSDDYINEKYKRGEIRIITEQARYPLDNIKPMLASGKYDRNPEYQRRKRWDNIRKSRLIESFIMNVPIPPIFLYEVEYSFFEVMDGLQRLTAIDDFYKDSFPLEGLQYWKELNGKIYSNLPSQIKAGIDRRYLSSIVLLQETAKTKEEAEFLKQMVFERLNSGGELLTPQETRNALYNGKFNRLCIELAKKDNFREMWQLPLESAGETALLESIPYRKMEDVELVLRFFAYRHIKQLKSPIDKFLDEYLKHANNLTDDSLKKLGSVFNETIDLIYTVLGKYAFFLPGTWNDENKSPKKTIYDPMMQAFSRILNKKDILIEKKESIVNDLYQNKTLLNRQKEKNPYIFDGRYNNRKDVQDRVEYFENFLNQYI